MKPGFSRPWTAGDGGPCCPRAGEQTQSILQAIHHENPQWIRNGTELPQVGGEYAQTYAAEGILLGDRLTLSSEIGADPKTPAPTTPSTSRLKSQPVQEEESMK